MAYHSEKEAVDWLLIFQKILDSVLKFEMRGIFYLDLGFWIKARGLGQGCTRPAGRAPGRPGAFLTRQVDFTSIF